MASSTSEAKAQAYQKVWKEWATSNPAAIENDDPAWWEAVRAAVDGVEIAKHPGPDGAELHSTGTGPEVHGGGGGGGTATDWVDEKIEEIIGPEVPMPGEGMTMEEMQERIDDIKLALLPAARERVRGTGRAMDAFRRQLQGEGIPQPWKTHDEYKEVVAAWEDAGLLAGNLEQELTLLEENLAAKRRSLHYSDDVKLPSEWIMNTTAPGHPEDAIPDQLPRWTEAAPNYDILQEVDSRMFAGTDGYNENWNRRTREGLQVVARAMDKHYGEQIQESLDRFHDNYYTEIETFADHQWEKYTGIASEGGYDAEGNETWRKYMKPRWIEGQATIGVKPWSSATDAFDGQDEFVHDDFRGQDHTFDSDNAYDIRDFVSNTRFVQALEAEGVNVLTIRPSRPISRGTDTWEREIARVDVRDTVLMHLGDLEDDLGYTIEASKDGSNMVDIIQEWSAPITEGGAWDSISHKITQDLRARWANSATDPLSIAVHYAVDDLFPTRSDTTHFDSIARAEGEAFYRMFPEVFKGYVSSVYAHTQAGFKKMGVTHVPLVRGMGAIEGDDLIFSDTDIGDWERGFDLFDEIPAPSSDIWNTTYKDFNGFSVRKQWPNQSILILDGKGDHQLTLNPHKDGYKIAWTADFDYGDQGGGVLTSSEDLISYLRSDHPELLYSTSDWVEAQVDMQPLSSFGTKTDTSRTFAPSYDSDNRGITHSLLMRATVPVEWIWGHSSDGFGSLREHEVLVLGGEALPFDVVAVPLGESLPSELIYKGLG